MRYLVSSCLAGVACRYNGTASLDERIRELVEQDQANIQAANRITTTILTFYN